MDSSIPPEFGKTGCVEIAAGRTNPAAHNYGWFAAKSAFEYAASQSSLAAATSADWWLDVETANSWSTDTAMNVVDIQGPH